MKHNDFDIADDEIRVIDSHSQEKKGAESTGKPNRWRVLVYIAILVVGVIGVIMWIASSKDVDDTVEEITSEVVSASQTSSDTEKTEGFTLVTDTVVEGTSLRLLTPKNALPSLEIGAGPLSDANTVLAVWAADVRSDNGEIAGAYVVDGQLISRGEAKAGYCAIINGEMEIGVADATPRLEEAITKGGYFFRQYPLVVGGQPIENKPKGKALRRALVETADGYSVVLSRTPLTLNDFARTLAALGVRNAISLVGSSTAATYLTSDGTRATLGTPSSPTAPAHPNLNYLVWKNRD